jgi:hypothetical protein
MCPNYLGQMGSNGWIDHFIQLGTIAFLVSASRTPALKQIGNSVATSYSTAGLPQVLG